MAINVAQAKVLVSAETQGEERLRQLRQELEALNKVTGQNNAVNNAAAKSDAVRRQSMVQLGQQIGDVGVQLQMGTSAARVFAMQAGQVGFALAGMGGKLGAVGTFLAGPWGAAITIAVSTLGMLAEELLSTADAAKDVEFATYKMSDAQGILGSVMDLTTGKINTQKDALLGLARAQIIAGQVKARADQAEAKSALQGLAAPGWNLSGGMGGGVSVNTGVKRVESGIIEAFMDGSMNVQDAVIGLKSLAQTGTITEKAMLTAAKAVTDFAVAAENEKVFNSAEAALNGDKGATRQFLRPTRTRKGPKAPTAEDIADAYATAINAATQDELKARRALTNSIEDRYQAELEAIASDVNQKRKDLANNEKLNDAQKQVVNALITSAELKRKELARLKKEDEQNAAAAFAADAKLRAEADEQGLMLDLAQTAKARKEVQLDLLRIEMEQRRIALQKIVDTKLGISPEERAAAQNELANLPATALLRKAVLDEQTKSPVDKYADDMVDTATKVQQAWANALQGTEDALVSFITTGKLSFKDLANSIIADIARIAVQQAIMLPLTSWLKGIGMIPAANGAAFGAGGVRKFATGGIVSGATPFAYSGGMGVMGEAGPEAIMPLKRLSNGKLGVHTEGGGSQSVVVNVNVESGNSEAMGDPGKAAQLGNLIAGVVRNELVVQKRPGGILAAA